MERIRVGVLPCTSQDIIKCYDRKKKDYNNHIWSQSENRPYN